MNFKSEVKSSVMFWFVLFVHFSCFIEGYGQNSTSTVFTPAISLESCTRRALVVRLSNASDTGTLFIKGQTTNCQEPTTSQESTYTFIFDSCGIKWGTAIYIVVQKHSNYQTGQDRTFPIECNADLSGIDLEDQNLDLLFNDNDKDNTTITVRPTASMTLYSDGRVVNGKSVALSQRLRMDLKLDSNFIDDFDIEARYCTAATIPVVNDFCSRDDALFPNFQKMSYGFLRTEFGAFRVTTLQGGAVEMVFTCILKVCLGNCSRPSCQDGTGRRKRSEVFVNNDDEADRSEEDGRQSAAMSHSRIKRQARIKDITVGAKVKVVTRKVVNDDEGEDEICIDPNLFYGMMAGAGAALGATIIASMLLKRKEKEQNKALTEQGPPKKQQRRRKK